MALTSTQLETARDTLRSAIYAGVSSVHFIDRRVDYQTVEEMRKALADLNDQIAGLTGTAVVRRSYAAFSKQ